MPAATSHGTVRQARRGVRVALVAGLVAASALLAACGRQPAVVTSATAGAQGAAADAGTAGTPPATPAPTRTRPPAPRIDEELEAHEGPMAPTAPKNLGKGPQTVVYTYVRLGSGWAHFARVTGVGAVKPVEREYLRASHGGTAVADLAVLTYPGDRAVDPAFATQAAAQAVRQISGASAVVHEQLLGRPLVYAGGAHPAAAWFGADSVVVAVPAPGTADGQAARAVLYSYALNPHAS